MSHLKVMMVTLEGGEQLVEEDSGEEENSRKEENSRGEDYLRLVPVPSLAEWVNHVSQRKSKHSELSKKD